MFAVITRESVEPVSSIHDRMPLILGKDSLREWVRPDGDPSRIAKKALMNMVMEVVSDRYGRQVPKHAHGTQNLDKHTSSTRKMVVATMTLFDRIFDKTLLARRINHVACNAIKESDVPESESCEQLSLFDTEETIGERADDEKALEKERALQEAMLTIKHKFGKNAVLKGTNFTEGATAKERNRQIGGHKA